MINEKENTETPPEGASPIIIGVGGATRSGKTTLASGLAKVLDVPEWFVVHQDKCWKPPAKRPWNERFNKCDMECPEAVDWDRLECWIDCRVKQAKAQGFKYVIVEGFLIFTKLLDRFDKKILISIPKEVSYERRMNTKFVKQDEFDELIWPSHLKHGIILKGEDTLTCDGCLAKDQILAKSLDFIFKKQQHESN